ncbi:hypothetical protein V8G54_000045 (mitochondrion) [Vigna mungo]|uniref:NADH-ubiquinone oxidoreductase chain 6 n=1 Tax=Vigna mungo TaxID=3915 RepID=A0AAQ3SHB6_VIGMU
MFLMVTEFINYSEQIIRAARYIGQGLMITLSHANRLPVTIQYPYEKIISSERFRGRIHFEFDKCIACEVCVRVCPIDLPIVDWKLETDIRKKRLLNYSIDFGICIFCGNCIEYCPTNCLSMTEEYELSTYDRHELNYNLIALGRLPVSVIDDYTIRTIQSHFVAASQLLIYVGAINVLIIFAVMFMNGSDYYQNFRVWTVGDGITFDGLYQYLSFTNNYYSRYIMARNYLDDKTQSDFRARFDKY